MAAAAAVRRRNWGGSGQVGGIGWLRRQPTFLQCNQFALLGLIGRRGACLAAALRGPLAGRGGRRRGLGSA